MSNPDAMRDATTGQAIRDICAAPIKTEAVDVEGMPRPVWVRELTAAEFYAGLSAHQETAGDDATLGPPQFVALALLDEHRNPVFATAGEAVTARLPLWLVGSLWPAVGRINGVTGGNE